MRRVQTFVAGLTGADGRKFEVLRGWATSSAPRRAPRAATGARGYAVCDDADVLVFWLAMARLDAGLPVFGETKNRVELAGLRLERVP